MNSVETIGKETNYVENFSIGTKRSFKFKMLQTCISHIIVPCCLCMVKFRIGVNEVLYMFLLNIILTVLGTEENIFVRLVASVWTYAATGRVLVIDFIH